MGASTSVKGLRFRAVIGIQNINPYVLVSAKQAARIRKNWRRSLPVRVRVNGRPESPWRINLMPVGDGSFYLYLHGDVRRASGTRVGDTVTVELAFDPAYRGGPAHPVPRWFGDALRRKRRARQAWQQLSPSRRKEILRYLSNLKTPAARERNLERAMKVLSGSEARYMARSWND